MSASRRENPAPRVTQMADGRWQDSPRLLLSLLCPKRLLLCLLGGSRCWQTVDAFSSAGEHLPPRSSLFLKRPCLLQKGLLIQPSWSFLLRSLLFPDQVCCLCPEEGSSHHPLPLRVTVSPHFHLLGPQRFHIWSISPLTLCWPLILMGRLPPVVAVLLLGVVNDLWAQGSCGRRGAVHYLFSLWVTTVPISLSCSCADSAGLRGAKYCKI